MMHCKCIYIHKILLGQRNQALGLYISLILATTHGTCVTATTLSNVFGYVSDHRAHECEPPQRQAMAQKASLHVQDAVPQWQAHC